MVTLIENVSAHADYAEMARRPLEAEQCALIVVDIQEKLLPSIFQKEQVVRNSQLLIRAAGILKIPAIISTQYARGLGGTVKEIASLLGFTEANHFSNYFKKHSGVSPVSYRKEAHPPTS